MWDQAEEVLLDQRQRSIPPVLVRNALVKGTQAVSTGGRVVVTGRDGVVLEDVLSVVRAAREVVVFSSFLLSEPRAQRELLTAAERGCRVYGLIAAEAKLDRDVSDEDSFDARTIEEHRRMLDTFAGRVFIRSAPCFHAKCVLADPAGLRARGLLLTANLTTKALTESQELAVRLTADECRGLFEHLRFAMWELAERELAGKGQLDRVKALGECRLPELNGTVCVTTPARLQIREELLGSIHAAKGEILAASFGWDADHPVVDALCRRAADGLPVAVLGRLRPVGDHPAAHGLAALLKLRRAGARVYGQEWLHAKALVCDGEGLVMSANFQKHGLNEGFELGVRLRGADASALQGVLASWMEHSPWRLELPDTLGAVSGELVPLTGGVLPKQPRAIAVNSEALLDLPDVEADSADHLAEARIPESRLRQEAQTRGLDWNHRVRIRYVVRAPRLAPKFKPEEGRKPGEAGASERPGRVQVYRAPSGERVVAATSPDELPAARAVADANGIRRVVVLEAAS